MKKNCWDLHPARRPKGNKSRRSLGTRGPKCFGCGKLGHIRKDCRNNESNDIIATVNLNANEDVIDCYLRTFIDSGSSCHTVTDLNLLDDGTIVRTDRVVSCADGSKIKLTHKGERTLRVNQGTVKLSEVYFAKEMKYNLLSARALTRKGVKLMLDEKEAYLEKKGIRIHLERLHDLWSLPEGPKEGKIVTLRMEIGGKTNAATWHKRLGHVSDYKLRQMIDSGLAPKEAAGYDAAGCDICKLTHPKRRKVPKIAERSGLIAVQVDYMPMGHDEKGWKGEVGAYVFNACTKARNFRSQNTGTDCPGT